MELFSKRQPQKVYSGPNPDIGNNPKQTYGLQGFFDRFSNRLDVPTSYAVPTKPILGGGNHYSRQLNSYAPQIVAPQLVTNVGITGDGSNLFGQLTSLPLIDQNNSAPGN